jgi:glycerol-3-phosphate dehydrogenase
MSSGKNSRPNALIIGAGFTGCALAHDLTLRGFQVTVIERGEIASGTSGRTHGLLHSGGRYCVNDRESAIECIQENIILRRIAKQCIEYNEGFFVALNEEDLAYSPRFLAGAEACGIPVEEIPQREALRLEPNLNPQALAVYTVPDGVFDPLRLALAFAATARWNGAIFKTYHEATRLIIDGSGTCVGIEALDRPSDRKINFHADIVVNCTGAWAGHILQGTSATVEVTPTPGIMVAFDRRLINRALNRLIEPGDGDILIPQRRMVVIGTTSYETGNVDYIPIEDQQVEQMCRDACALVPAVAQTRMRGVYMSARPLVGSGQNGRSLTRTFKCFDHEQTGGIRGLITVTGGKATTCRAMAAGAADLACQKLGIHAECRTDSIPLRSYRDYYRAPGGDC